VAPIPVLTISDVRTRVVEHTSGASHKMQQATNMIRPHGTLSPPLPSSPPQALSVGLSQVMSFAYLERRAMQTQNLAVRLVANGIPLILPPGAHALYIDMVGAPPACAPRPSALALPLFLLVLESGAMPSG